MNPQLIKPVVAAISRNSPKILLFGSASFSALAVVSAIRATPNAYEEIHILADELDRPPSNREVFDRVWRYYVPTGLYLFSSISMGVAALVIQNRKTQAFAALAGTMAEAATRYNKNIIESRGVEVLDEVKEKVVSHKVKDDEPFTDFSGDGDTIFYDELSGRYFRGDLQSVRSVVNDLNKDLLSWNWVTVNQFYTSLGLSNITLVDQIGWDTDDLIEPRFIPAMSSDGTQYVIISHVAHPKPDKSYRPTY